MVVKGQSEGQNVIPLKVNSWFKNNIEKGELKNYRRLNGQNPEFLENYNFMLQRYINVTDTSIRRLLDELNKQAGAELCKAQDQLGLV